MRFSYNAIDLFSGCGGVSCGLTLSGFNIRAAVEIEPKAIDIYSAYPPLSKVNVLHRDICTLSGEEILKAAHICRDSVYLLAGCPLVRTSHVRILKINTRQLRSEKNSYLNFCASLRN